jgi:hypothetical protein
VPLQIVVSHAVALLPVWGEVIRSIDFQDQLQLDAAKIGRVRRDRILAAKLLVADLPVANPLPHRSGKLIGRGALGTREVDGLG